MWWFPWPLGPKDLRIPSPTLSECSRPFARVLRTDILRQGCFVSCVRELAFEVKNIFKPMFKPTASFSDPAGIRRIPGICSESDWTFGPKTDMQGALDARPSQKTISSELSNLEHGFSMISQTRRSHLYTSDTEPSVYFNRYKTMAEPSVTSKYLADTWLREELPLGSSKFGIYRLQFLLHRSK